MPPMPEHEVALWRAEMAAEYHPPMEPRTIIRDRIASLALRKHQAAERVAPLWRLSPRDAASKLDHYLAAERDINSTAFVQLCEALGLVIVPAATATAATQVE